MVRVFTSVYRNGLELRVDLLKKADRGDPPEDIIHPRFDREDGTWEEWALTALEACDIVHRLSSALTNLVEDNHPLMLKKQKR